MIAGLGYAVLALAAAAATVVGIYIHSKFVDASQAEWLPTLTSIGCITLTLFCLILIPVDIYSAQQNGALSDFVFMLGYVFYLCILLVVFVMIPFAYFHFEESGEEVSQYDRIFAGAKYTVFLLVFLVLLLVVGIFLKADMQWETKDEASEYLKEIIEDRSVVSYAVSFALAVFAVLGSVIWCTYTAYGMSALPVSFIKGKRRLVEEKYEVESGLSSIREQQRAVASKYPSSRAMSARDRDALDDLQARERALQMQASRLGDLNTTCNKISEALKPFTLLIGVVLLVLSFLFVASMVYTSILEALPSMCGAKCGFILNNYPYEKIPFGLNPIDWALFQSSKYFPLDFVLFGGLALYIFVCTLSGIRRMGIRFLWLKMYTVEAGATPPQGVLLLAALLACAVLSLSFQLVAISPQYATWGSQEYTTANGTMEHCVAGADGCRMTELAKLSAQMANINLSVGGMPVFGLLHYLAAWLFAAVWLVGTVVAFCTRQASNTYVLQEDYDEDLGAL
mmetsp:Transcript_13978/g.35702  ORF Transcript_13978/g.35702 Transcript_13978/m.35702 type:complete len:510 (+) Transcript_13978:59-1588(+)